jgi:hypothetical protein
MLPDGVQRSDHRGPGGQAVVDDDDDAAAGIDRRPPTQRRPPPPQHAQLLGLLAGEVRGIAAGLRGVRREPHPTALVDRAHDRRRQRLHPALAHDDAGPGTAPRNPGHTSRDAAITAKAPLCKKLHIIRKGGGGNTVCCVGRPYTGMRIIVHTGIAVAHRTIVVTPSIR